VVVYAGVAEVRGHDRHRGPPAEVQELLVTVRFELEQRRAELEPLRPLGPAAGGVFALDGEDRSALGRVPALVELSNLLGRDFEQVVHRRQEVGGRKVAVELDHGGYNISAGGRGESGRRHRLVFMGMM
jgi:hypothetical protein